MSLLDKLPHLCTIRRRTRRRDSLGGMSDDVVVVDTEVECWEQQTSSSESRDWEKRGENVDKKIYFTSRPEVTVQHEIMVTHRNGIEVSDPIAYTVISQPEPDVTVGRGLLYRVMVSQPETPLS